MWAVRAILIALVIIIVVAFAYFNLNSEQTINVDLIYVKYVEVPLVTVVFWSFIAGMLISLFLFISIYIKLTIQLRNATRKIQALEGEVTVLRNRPIEESADMINNAAKKETDSPFENMN